MKGKLTMSNLYEDMGKLLFETGLPQVFGLYPGDDIRSNKEAFQTMMGLLKNVSHGEYTDERHIAQLTVNS